MTHEEAYNKALKVKWKVEPCFSGEECWCRLIVPDEPIKYSTDDIEEVYIVGSASINKQMAEHIVKIHNQYINNGKQQIIDAYMDRIDCTDKEHFSKIIGEQYYNETFKK